jgi:hypothetical protein
MERGASTPAATPDVAAGGQQRSRRSRSGRGRGRDGCGGRGGCSGGVRPRICYACGAAGHLKRQCPLAAGGVCTAAQTAVASPLRTTADAASDGAATSGDVGGDDASVVVVDGSTMEGGGQVLRLSCALGAICGLPLRVHSIRAKRPRPGLAAQHLTGLRLLEGAFAGGLG